MVREKRATRPQRASRPRKAPSIWDTPRIKRMLAEPVGTPMELTAEEANAIIDEHLANPDLYDPEEGKRRLSELRKIRQESGAVLVGRSLEVND